MQRGPHCRGKWSPGEDGLSSVLRLDLDQQQDHIGTALATARMARSRDFSASLQRP